MRRLTDAEIRTANIQRQRQGKRALTRDQAQTAVASVSAIDLNTLLTSYVLFDPGGFVDSSCEVPS